MDVRILSVSTGEQVAAKITKAKRLELPSMHDGWRFNFDKLAYRLANATAYVLICDDTPAIVEGAMIFQMKEGYMPYLAYLEIAPHNRGDLKRYENVAGCLIACAYKLSIKSEEGNPNVALTLDVREAYETDQRKLMSVYSQNYQAKALNDTTMYIDEAGGEILIERFLKF